MYASRVLPRGRKNSLVPVPRPCVSSRMEVRHSSLVLSTITFTFYPCRGNTYVRTYVRMYVAPVPASMLSSEPAFYSGCTRRARKENPMQSRTRCISRSFARGVNFSCFLVVHFMMYTHIQEGDGKWERCYVSRNSQSISICEDDKALIAKR